MRGVTVETAKISAGDFVQSMYTALNVKHCSDRNFDRLVQILIAKTYDIAKANHLIDIIMIFDAHDINKDGILSLAELRPFARQFGVTSEDDLSRFAYRMDTSGSGEVRLHDFVKFMWKQLEGSGRGLRMRRLVDRRHHRRRMVV